MHHRALHLLIVPMVAVALFVPTSARGQRANYENVIFGEASTGMSGAAIGLADDASAVFYNPAGLARVSYDVLSISVLAFGARNTLASEYLRRGDQTASAESSTFGVLPTSVVYVIPIGGKGGVQHRLGLSVVTPVSHDYAFSQSLTDDGGNVFVATTTLRETEYLGGMTYAIGFGPVSLGATAYAQYVSVAFGSLLSADDESANGDLRLLSSARRSEGTQVGMTGVLGAYFQLSRSWSIGLRARLPNLSLYSSARHTFTETDSMRTAGTWSTQQVAVGGLEGSMEFPHPLGLGAGVGYRARRLSLAFDVKTYLPLDGFTLFDGPIQMANPPNPDNDWDPSINIPPGGWVVNLAMGGEFFATEAISFLFGVSSDVSAQSPQSAFDVSADATMSYLTFATGLRHTSNAGTFTMSLSFRHGRGSINSIEWDDDFVPGARGDVQQSSGFVTVSWSRSLTDNWLELRRELRQLTGSSPD